MSSRSTLIRNLALPITRLHVPFVSAQVSRTVERWCDDRNVTTRARGLRWELDLNELIEHRIFYLGTHERFTTRRILEALPRGGVLLDVGANIGYFAVLAANKVGPSGKVYAFEPMRRAYDKLVRHVNINQLSNVVTEKVVLGSEPGDPIEVSFQNSWRLYERTTNDAERETVPVTTLDAYAEANGISRVDVLKIDVDGFELKVLTGARRLLARCRPTIVIELGKYTLASAGDSLDALLALLDGAGYRIYSEVTMRRFASLAAVSDSVPPNGTINVVCRTS